MAILPSASVTLTEAQSASVGGASYIVVAGCVAQNADRVPRVISSTSALLATYGYNPAVDYCALHFAGANLPVIFVGLPIATAGAITSTSNTGNTGTCNITASVGANGAMEQVSGVVVVQQGGVVGTAQIQLGLSLDGGISFQNVRLGSNTSYVIPNIGVTLNFESGGQLNAGDTVFTFATTAPMWGSTDMGLMQTALAGQQNLSRTWLVVGELPNSTFANYVLTAANGYASANSRFTLARTSVVDRSPLPTKSKINVFAAAPGSTTFAAGGHTITRTTGSFVTDGFVTGQIVTVAGSTLNNGVVGVLTNVAATILTFASGVASETVASGVVITGSEAITFAAAGFTITRSGSSLSFLTEGFAVGQSVTIAGSVSNNQTNTITALSATVMTFASGIVNEGPSASSGVTITQSQTMAVWVSAEAAAFATIDASPRIDISLGRGVVQSPITGYTMRRPAAWAASIREYQHDVQTPCWRKSDGPLQGWSITDANGNKVEYDERLDGGGLAARFTTLRTYANGPLGAFVSLSLTRDTDGAYLSRSHNMQVANLALQVVQAETENAIGTVLQLNANGTGTEASLSLIEQKVNTQLQNNLLQGFKEGPRASSASWVASRTDNLSVVPSTMNGVLSLLINGTLEQINTITAVT